MKSVSICSISIIILFSISCSVSKNYIKHYCIKGDPSSLRIIPLKEPFTPICDSIVLMNNLAIGKLENFEAKISSEYKKVYNEKVQELDNKTYFKLSILIGYFEAYRSRPCDENAYKDYIQNLNQIRETLFNLDNLNSDIDKIIKGKGISGTSPTDLINRVSKFLNMN